MAEPDVRLLIGVARGGKDGNSDKEIKREIEDILNKLKPKIKLDAKDFTSQVRKQLGDISKDGKFYIKVSNIKLGENAIADFRRQLNAVIDTLSVEKGVNVSVTPKVNNSVSAAPKTSGSSLAAETAALVAYNEAQKERAEITETVANAETQADKTDKSRMATNQQVLNTYKQLNDYLAKNPRAAGTSQGSQLADIRDELGRVARAGEGAADGMSAMTGVDLRTTQEQINRLKISLRESGKEGRTVGGIIKSAYAKFGGWMLVTRSMTSVIRSLKEMVDNVRQIDAAMTELKKVTNETDAVYSKFLTNAASRARTLGVTVADIITATADFARLGYSIDEASTLADVATIYKNVGDGIDSISTASESIISTMKAFGIEAKDAMLIVDKFNEVGNNFAISSKGVGDALIRSAAALRAAGNSLDESIALVTAANNVVQDPDKVGTTMKTVSMFLRAAKTEAEEAGESTEGMASSVSELRGELLALTGGKVDIQLDENTFKSTYDIIKDLSKVWSELTDITKANILEMIGGKRNSNVVAALLEDFSTADKVVETAANSAGSAMAENEKYLDSINGKVAQFQASFEKLSMTVVNSEFVKGVVDFGTSVVDVLTKIVDLLGDIPTLLGAIGIATSASKKRSILSPYSVEFKGDGSWSNSFSKGFTTQINLDTQGILAYNEAVSEAFNNRIIDAQNASMTMRQYFAEHNDILESIYNSTLSGSSKVTAEYVKSANGATIATDGLTRKVTELHAKTLLATAGQIALNAAMSAGITLLLSAAISGITHLINKRKEELQAAKDSVTEYENVATSLESYSAKITELKASLDSGTLSEEASYKAKQDLLQVQDELIDKYGTEIGKLDLLRMTSDEAAAAIDRVTQAMARKNLRQNKDAIDDAIDEMTKEKSYFAHSIGWVDSESDILQHIKNIVSKYDGALLEEGVVNADGKQELSLYITANAENAQKALTGLKDDLYNLQRQYRENGINIDDIFQSDTPIEEIFDSALDNIEETIKNNKPLFDEQIIWRIVANPDYTSLQTSAEAISTSLDEAYNSINEEGAVERFEAVKASILDVQKALDETDFDDENNGVKDYLQGILDDLQDAADGFVLEAELRARLKNPEDDISKGLKEALSKFEKDGVVTLAAVLDAELYVRDVNLSGAAGAAIRGAMADKLKAYTYLNDLAQEYGMDVSGLFNVAGESGYVPGYTLKGDGSSSDSDGSGNKDDPIKKLKEAFDEIIGDFEHSIAMLENKGGSASEIVRIYQQMQEAVHAQAEKYRSMGLSENSDYIQELQKQWWEYRKNIEEAIVADYEKATGERENSITLTENWLDKAIADRDFKAARQYSASIAEYYRQMQNIVHDQADYLRSQGYSDTSDEVSKLSDLWWDYAKNIEEVKQKVIDGIADMVTETSDELDSLQDAYDALKSAADEYAENGGFISVDSFQAIASLSPEYIQLLKDENGLLVINEERIKKVMAAKTREMALDSVKAYIERLRLAMQEDSIENLNKLTIGLNEATEASWGMYYAELASLGLGNEQYDAALHYVNSIRSLYESAAKGFEFPLEGAEALRDGMDDTLGYVMDMIKQKVEDEINAINEMKDAYGDIISLRKEALDAAKDEADYEDEVADKVNQIAKLQNRINALSLDDSRSAQAQKVKLEEEMAKLQKELGKFQNEHAIEAQKEALDKMKEDYDAEKDAEIAELEESISSQQKLYDKAINYITDKWEDDWDSLFTELLSWNYKYGSELESTLVSAWDKATLAAEKYNNSVKNAMQVYGLGNGYGEWGAGGEGGTGSGLGTDGSGSGNKVVANAVSNWPAGNIPQILNKIGEMYNNTNAWHTANASYRQWLEDRNYQIGTVELKKLGINAYRDEASGIWYDEDGQELYKKYDKIKDKFHTGGIVGRNPTTKQNEVMALLEKGEAVLDDKKEKGLYRIVDFATILSERLGKAIDTSALLRSFPKVNNGFAELAAQVANGAVGSPAPSIHFGDVYISGADESTLEKHREINRQFTNEVLKQLNIKK